MNFGLAWWGNEQRLNEDQRTGKWARTLLRALLDLRCMLCIGMKAESEERRLRATLWRDPWAREAK